MSLSNIVDELLDQDGLANICTAEKTNLSTMSVRSQKVDSLNISFRHLCSCQLIKKARGGQHEELDTFDRPAFTDGSNDVHDVTTSCSQVAFLMGIWMGALVSMTF